MSAEPVAVPAPRHRRWWAVWLLAVVGMTADQWSKSWALASLRPGEPVPVLPPALHWNLVFNPGAAFSLGTSVTPLFTGLLVVVAVAVGWASTQVTSGWWACGMGLLLGGVVGNLHDRLFRPPSPGFGHVVDFIQLPNYPVFNIADSCICVAAAVMVVATWRQIPWREPGGQSSEDVSTVPMEEPIREEAVSGPPETVAPSAPVVPTEAMGPHASAPDAQAHPSAETMRSDRG